jgi:hypothetical protein
VRLGLERCRLAERAHNVASRSRALAAPARSAAVTRGVAFASWSSSFAWSIFSVSLGSSPAMPANAEWNRRTASPSRRSPSLDFAPGSTYRQNVSTNSVCSGAQQSTRVQGRRRDALPGEAAPKAELPLERVRERTPAVVSQCVVILNGPAG